jgi:hypothetical protein
MGNIHTQKGIHTMDALYNLHPLAADIGSVILSNWLKEIRTSQKLTYQILHYQNEFKKPNAASARIGPISMAASWPGEMSRSFGRS